MSTNVVRVVVKGWTWVCGEADNTTRAKRMLLEALDAEGWPRKQVDVTITAGGFIRVPFPRTYDSKGGACGWGIRRGLQAADSSGFESSRTGHRNRQVDGAVAASHTFAHSRCRPEQYLPQRRPGDACRNGGRN